MTGRPVVRSGGWLSVLFHERAELGELLVPELLALAALHAGENVLDERGRLERVERLRDVVDAADVEAAGAVAELGPRGEEDDRDPARLLVEEELLGDAPTVEPGHHHVEEDHVGLLRPRLLEAARAVGGFEDVHPLGLEVDPAQKPDRGLVVDHEHLCHPLSLAPPLYPPEEDLTPPRSLCEPARSAARTRRWSPRPPRTRRRSVRPSPRRGPAR